MSNFALFIFIIASASTAAEASSEVASIPLILPEEKGRSNWSQQSFITLADKKNIHSVENRSHQEEFNFRYKWDTAHLSFDHSQFQSSQKRLTFCSCIISSH
ncbi:hypothetical protein NPIL_318391 [Nephila pilipes]|uniref:Uncharacterized protein n=1 Tax=Nephila pilipes TaxID=299642 RepID=A0A8X6UU40_NEPPI|nr:hypothetical protein NPIL_318391 [Nephila pilipes]